MLLSAAIEQVDREMPRRLARFLDLVDPQLRRCR